MHVYNFIHRESFLGIYCVELNRFSIFVSINVSDETFRSETPLAFFIYILNTFFIELFILHMNMNVSRIHLYMITYLVVNEKA